MAITAALVKELRERSGAGMMDCKKALVENDGDLEKALEFLQIKGMAKAGKKAGRVAAEGLVGSWISDDGKTGSIIEVNCETDFVARNDEFQAFVAQLAEHAGSNGLGNLDALMSSEIGGESVETLRTKKVASIGENISVRRVELLKIAENGVIGTYLHGGGTIGAIVKIKAASDVSGNEAVADLARDVCMHIAASNPRFTRDSEVDADTVEKEKHILTEQALESGKPKEIVEKMIVGRLKKWMKEICLVNQPFVKNPDLNVQQEVARVAKEVGVELAIATFVRFAKGEGIEKQESNLADEVAALQK